MRFSTSQLPPGWPCLLNTQKELFFFFFLFIVLFLLFIYLLFVIVCILTLFLQDTQHQQVVPYPLRLYFLARVHNHSLFSRYLEPTSCPYPLLSLRLYFLVFHSTSTTMQQSLLVFSRCLLACLLTNKIFLLLFVYCFFLFLFLFFIIVVVFCFLLRLYIFN